MSIVKMKSVMLFGQLEHADRVIMTCFNQGCFHPEDAAVITENDKHYTRLAESNPYQETLAKISELAKDLSHELQYIEQPTQMSTAEAESILHRINRDLERAEQQVAELKRRIDFCENALGLLAHMGNLDVDLDELFASKFLKLRFGRLPLDSYHKLNYYREKLFLFLALDQDEDYCWGVCFTVENAVAETDAILSSLSFERLWVSDDLHGTPQEAREKLEEELRSLQQQHTDIQTRLNQGAEQRGTRLDNAYSRMKNLYDTYELRRYMVASKDIFLAVGFVPATEAESFAAALSVYSDVTVEIGDAGNLKNLSPPTLLKNNPFLKPMEFFVRLYGLPGYHDVDPTTFLGITYLLLFGIMFGDVGQGVAISLIGWVMIKKGMEGLGAVMTRLGISSAFFGFLYGSVFGYENALDFFYIDMLGLHEKPLEVLHPSTITQILIVAVSLGAVLLYLSMVINTVTAFSQKDYPRALLHQNGVPGLVFYGSVLAAVVCTFLGGPNLAGNWVYIICGFVLPLLIIFFKEPLTHRFARRHGLETEGHGGFSPIEGFFELFEVLLGFVTNTISFLRVGGFVLSHAGMMTVVMILANMIGGLGGIIMVIFGNIFVMVLEGMVCGIQVLRLQFYELFSHYFAGGGKPFQPVGLKSIEN